MNRLLLCATLLLAGCGGVAPKIVEKPILVDRPELIVPEIQPAEQYNFEWIVITKENFAEVAKDLESKGQTIVLFAVTPQGYQNLSVNIAELRRFITQQQSVIVSYKTYYGKKTEEPKVEEKKPFWKIF